MAIRQLLDDGNPQEHGAALSAQEELMRTYRSARRPSRECDA